MDFSTLVLIIVAIFILGLSFLFLISKRKKKLSKGEEGFVRTQWRMISSGHNPKNDILEADKLLDFVLKKYNYSGSVAEKLKQSSKLFSDLNGLWTAHKLRNRLAHEINFHPSEKEVRSALASFKRALLDLKIRL